MKALLYCTKNKPYLYGNPFILKTEFDHYCLEEQKNAIFGEHNLLNGKIAVECDFEVEGIKLNEYDDYNFSHYSGMYFETETLQEEELCKQSGLTADELDEYLGLYKNKEIHGCAIHIKNLHIFDEPRELAYSTCDNDAYYYSEKYDKKRKCKVGYAITTAPKNMCYVFDKNGNKYVFISIYPDQLCKALNGECTIIVKKTVLKGMLEND